MYTRAFVALLSRACACISIWLKNSRFVCGQDNNGVGGKVFKYIQTTQNNGQIKYVRFVSFSFLFCDVTTMTKALMKTYCAFIFPKIFIGCVLFLLCSNVYLFYLQQMKKHQVELDIKSDALWENYETRSQKDHFNSRINDSLEGRYHAMAPKQFYEQIMPIKKKKHNPENSGEKSDLKFEPTLVFARVLGNDLPPLHSTNQTAINTRTVLENETTLPSNCKRLWILNSIADKSKMDYLIVMLKNYNEEFRVIETDFNSPRKIVADGLNVNRARNLALKVGFEELEASWVFLFDGAAFLTTEGYSPLVVFSKEQQEKPVFHFTAVYRLLYKIQLKSELRILDILNYTTGNSL